MPGVIHPAVKVLADVGQIYLAARVIGLPLFELTPETPQARPTEPAGIRPKVVAEEVQTATAAMRYRENAGFVIGAQVEVVGQPPLSVNSQRLQVALVGMNDHEVIHVPDVPVLALSALHPLVERIHIDVGEQLTGQVADRQTFARGFRLAVAADDVLDNRHQPAICQALTQQLQQDVVVDAGEVLPDISLQHINPAMLAEALLKHFLGLVGARMGALTNPAGVAVPDESGLPDRLYRADDGVLNHAIAEELQGGYLPALWLGDIKAAVRAALVLAPDQVVLQLNEIAFQVFLEVPAGPAFALAFAGAEISLVQGVEGDDLFEYSVECLGHSRSL